MTTSPYAQPPTGLLRSGHVQTLLSSRALSLGLDRDNPFTLAERRVLTSRDGVRLEAFVHAPHADAPQVILIHGWLGDGDVTVHSPHGHHAGGLRFQRLPACTCETTVTVTT